MTTTHYRSRAATARIPFELATKSGAGLKLGFHAIWLVLALSACGEKPVSIDQMSDVIASKLENTTPPEALSERAPIDVSLGMERAIARAVHANEGYQAAVAMEAASGSAIGVAASTQRPEFSGNANLGGVQETGGGADTTTAGLSAGINISQLVYDGGASSSAINQATAEALASKAAREVQGNELALQAANAWIDVWQYDARLALLRTRTGALDTVVSQMGRMAANGMIDRASLDNARRQIIDMTLEETRLASAKQDSRVRFSRFFNSTPRGIVRPADMMSLAQARTAAANWQQAPALQRSAAELIIAHGEVAGAKAAFKPRVRLQAGVRTPMKSGESTDTSVGFVVEYAFSDGGRRKSRLETAQARAVAATAQLTDAQRTLEAELDAALARLAAIERSMPLLKRQIELSASEAKTARTQLATGQSTLRQLVDAEIENYRVRDRLISMDAEYRVLLLTIAARSGALGRQIGLEYSDAS